MKHYAYGISADSFDEVEALYNSIKPIVSKVVLASTDLRPVAARRNKHEYIKKFSKNCYAICMSGIHSPTDYNGTVTAPELSDADQLRGAPIVWRRTKTGESITIHNDSYGQSTGWYGVLHACLPRGMYFHTNNGAHKLTFQGSSYYLPLNRHVPAPDPVVGRDLGAHLRKDPLKGAAPKFERAVTFSRTLTGRTWHLTSEAYESSAVRAVVDKDAKAPLLEGIKAYKKWLYATMPLLMDESSRSLEKTATAELVAFAATDLAPEGLAEAVAYVSTDYYLLISPPAWRASTVLASASRSAIMEPDHPLRMAMAMAMIAMAHEAEGRVGDRYRSPDPDFSPAAVTKRYKSRINTYINKALRLVTTT